MMHEQGRPSSLKHTQSQVRSACASSRPGELVSHPAPANRRRQGRQAQARMHRLRRRRRCCPLGAPAQACRWPQLAGRHQRSPADLGGSICIAKWKGLMPALQGPSRRPGPAVAAPAPRHGRHRLLPGPWLATGPEWWTEGAEPLQKDGWGNSLLVPFRWRQAHGAAQRRGPVQAQPACTAALHTSSVDRLHPVCFLVC